MGYMKVNYKKIVLIAFVFLFILNINNILALEIKEPIQKNIDLVDNIDIGYISENESFLVSFVNENNDNYNIIILDENQKDIDHIIIENTKNTKESIFTTLKVKDYKGPFNIKLKLIDYKNEKTKNIQLNTIVSNDVISSIVLPYKRKINYNKNELGNLKIKLRVINKAVSEKTIYLTSDLVKYNMNDYKEYHIKPNSVQDIEYRSTLPVVGEHNFNLYIFSDKGNINLEDLKDIKNNINNQEVIVDIKNINVEVIKDLDSVLASKKHFFPLFSLNSLPIYFFNNFIRII
jgi:hypothetical protein